MGRHRRLMLLIALATLTVSMRELGLDYIARKSSQVRPLSERHLQSEPITSEHKLPRSCLIESCCYSGKQRPPTRPPGRPGARWSFHAAKKAKGRRVTNAYIAAAPGFAFWRLRRT